MINEPHSGRPAWIDDIATAWYEPKIKVEDSVRRRGENGTSYRRCWVWFIGNPPRNHHIHIDQSSYGFELGIGCHCSAHKDIEVRTKVEPDDEDVRAALALAGWDLIVPVATLAGGAA